jgi:hypothetical protein
LSRAVFRVDQLPALSEAFKAAARCSREVFRGRMSRAEADEEFAGKMALLML